MKILNVFFTLLVAFSWSVSIAQLTPSIQQKLSVPKNYLQNGGFESGTAGWSTYVNTAQVMPVNGTGGTASVTIAATTSSPLADKASGLLTKPASNVQGQGYSYAFTIEPMAQGRIMSIQGTYQIASGSYSGGSSGPPIVDSDLEVYIYDVDAGQIIQPNGYRLDGGVVGLSYPIYATFQPTSISSTHYRLIFQHSTTSASAFSIKLDGLSVSLQLKSNGAVNTDWMSYTPTFSNFGTVSNVNFKSRRVGDSLEVLGTFQTGTTVAAAASVTLGFNGANANVSADTSKVPGSSLIGTATQNTSSSTYFGAYVLAPATNSSSVNFGVQTSTVPGTSYANGNSFASTTVVELHFVVPIASWSSLTTMSSDSGDSRGIAFDATIGGQSTAASTNVQLTNFTVISDPASTFSSNTFTAPAPGVYKVDFNVTANAFSTGSATVAIVIFKNGSAFTSASTGTNAAGSSVTLGPTIPMAAGDKLTFYFNGGSGNANGVSNGNISVFKTGGSSQIAMSDSVTARYSDTSGAALGTSPAIFKFTSLNWDNTASYSTTSGLFTCSAPGKYSVKASIGTTAMTMSSSSYLQTYIYKNGSLYSSLGFVYGNGATGVAYDVTGSDEVSCVAGDSFGIYAISTTATSANTSSGVNHLSIVRVAN